MTKYLEQDLEQESQLTNEEQDYLYREHIKEQEQLELDRLSQDKLLEEADSREADIASGWEPFQ